MVHRTVRTRLCLTWAQLPLLVHRAATTWTRGTPRTPCTCAANASVSPPTPAPFPRRRRPSSRSRRRRCYRLPCRSIEALSAAASRYTTRRRRTTSPKISPRSLISARFAPFATQTSALSTTASRRPRPHLPPPSFTKYPVLPVSTLPYSLCSIRVFNLTREVFQHL